MTRDEAVKICRAFGMTRTEATMRYNLPQHICDRILNDAAEDDVDLLMALGILKCDAPAPAEASEVSDDR